MIAFDDMVTLLYRFLIKDTPQCFSAFPFVYVMSVLYFRSYNVCLL